MSGHEPSWTLRYCPSEKAKFVKINTFSLKLENLKLAKNKKVVMKELQH
jgi:hypothetical protein